MKSELQGPSWSVLLLRVPPGRSLELWWQVEVVVGGGLSLPDSSLSCLAQSTFPLSKSMAF